MVWDIFCRVIDNYGDIGVCWRLAAGLASRGASVRLWSDDLSALEWLAPEGHAGVQAMPWPQSPVISDAGDAVIEAFGCELPPAYQAAMANRAAAGRAPAWINLEYLTAESFAERAHGLPSPVMQGPAAGLTKHFFYPGFTPGTGGLIREDKLAERQARFDRAAWLEHQGISFTGEDLVSLFCYEPAALADLLERLQTQERPVRLLVTPGRAAAAVRAMVPPGADLGALSITWLAPLAQTAFDELLWACDFNFVRGEDSLVRALWAGKPMIWQAYPQDDGAHLVKLDAFLDAIAAPPSLREFHHAWNGAAATLPAQPDLQGWGSVISQARTGLWAQDDLITQLVGFVQKKR
ncbi:MAG: elongation factor P maturation arginine rhamnosyltransferase EarP [Burkholderiales bacterium]|nr:MAG: elongation factor P maturation arginine rhamnosyltransferase EarP [Burkholderiales bacterium]